MSTAKRIWISTFRILLAIAEGIITADPFAGYEAEHPEREQKYLTAVELQRLMTTDVYKGQIIAIRQSKYGLNMVFITKKQMER